MDKETVIYEMSNAFQSRTGALFVGAGISVPSKLPNWADLIEYEAKKLGLSLTDNEDLPEIAQWIVNGYVGNRGPLINHIRTALKKNKGPNNYHIALANTTVDTIWTTNYDTLLEDAFASFSLAVRASDASISHPTYGTEVEIIKMHGCLARSGHEDIVITKEDYEDFFHRRPATTERLRTDLLRRTFLFIGYGFGDHTIENIVVEARRLAQNAPLKHHLIQKRLNKAKDGQQRVIRQELWATDLRRIGIECTLIDDFQELQEILDDIALRSRGPSLYITGAHDKSNKLAKNIGSQIANLSSPEVIIIDGQSTGLSRQVITAFMEGCVNHKVDLRTRLKTFPNPYAANPKFSNDKNLLPILKSWRSTLLRSTQVVLAFDGGMGTEMEVELALSLGCRVIPVPIKAGGLADTLLQRPQIRDIIQHRCPDYLTKWQSGKQISAKDVMQCIGDMLK